MKNACIALAAVAAVAITTSDAFADSQAASAGEVVAKVEEAVALIRTGGEAALKIIADPSQAYVWKDTYVFVVNCEADLVVVNPAFPERVGGDIKQHTDYAGYAYGEQLCHTASRPEGGWVEYVWLKPGSDTPRRKISFVKPVPDMPYQVGAGIYDDSTAVAHRYEELHSDN